jgi:hypothetical protein
MRWVLLGILIAAAGTMYTLFRACDSTSLALHLCGATLERFAGFSEIDVSGTVLAGTVRLTFDAAGQWRNAKCMCDSGKATRVKLDGKLLFGFACGPRARKPKPSAGHRTANSPFRERGER